MVGFFCVTLFHVFSSVLIKEEYFEDTESVLYIGVPLQREDFDAGALQRCGFSNIVFVEDYGSGQGTEFDLNEMIFYTITPQWEGYFDSLNYKTLILLYEGITSYQLKNWVESTKSSLLQKSSEIWLPNINLLIDQEYLPKCKEFKIDLCRLGRERLEKLCRCLNEVFGYQYDEITDAALWMDRYLTTCSNFLSTAAENILTQAIYFQANPKPAIKKHPYDPSDARKYKNLPGAKILKENVPWELLYINNKLYNPTFYLDTYYVYNSFAPANIALLFGDTSFRYICLEGILNKYANIEKTYLNDLITKAIFRRFSQSCDVEVYFVDNLEDLNRDAPERRYATDDTLWDRAEKSIREEVGQIHILEIRNFRLQLDCALISGKKNQGKYYFTSENYSAAISRKILHIALPTFTETIDRAESDFIIDTDNSLVNYERDVFDVRSFNVIEGYYRLSPEESDCKKRLIQIDNLYIWGATGTNEATFNFLEKANQASKIRNVFDSYAKGVNHNFTIVPFDPSLIAENSFIYVCAAVAYKEISGILKTYGYEEGRDFCLGVGIKYV